MSDIVEILRGHARAWGVRADSPDDALVNENRMARDCAKAADMLEFLLNQMQMHSPQMNGAHSYRFISSGWPMNHCKGPSAEAAVKAAMAEVERARLERHAKGGET